ncbi:MAG TPA: hypothetical protein VMU54_25235 [Planctomycetota bacterium]|nr:hypothetical protein [Planctomycetota bacterium]
MIKVEEKRRRVEASFLDDLLKGLSKSMFNGLAERLEDGARELLRWSLKNLALTLVAIGITIAAGVLVLIAGVEGLQQASVPPFLAYLIPGIVGLAIGLTMMLMRR